MKHYKYLIVGGGISTDAAVRGIREMDSVGSIGVISSETDPPYKRPYLSKKLWSGKPLEKVYLHTDSLKVDLMLGRTATMLDPQQKRLTDDRRDTFAYDRILLATGGSPNHLPFGNGRIIYYRTLRDYFRLKELSGEAESFLVVGGGFIGAEVAASLRIAGKKVTMIFPEKSIGSRVYPRDLSLYITDYYRRKGVEILAGETVKNIEEGDGKTVVIIGTGEKLMVDGVVAGIGIHPNVELAERASLTVDQGIQVDRYLRASSKDIYAAGDVANFPSEFLGRRVRLEHEDNAAAMGRTAGRNMAGAEEAYTHIPMFYSDLFELGYEAVGDLDSRLETVAFWEKPMEKGVVYYLDQGRVKGVLLWNVWDSVDKARALMREGASFSPGELAGKI